MNNRIRKSTHTQDYLGRRLARWRNKRVAKEIDSPFLDIACGDNFLARNMCKGGFGIDVIDHGTADLVVSSFTDLPFESGYYQSLSIVASLNYFDDPVGVLAECRRLMKPNGHLIVTLLNPIIGRFWHVFREPWVKSSGISRGQLETIARQAGLQITKGSKFILGMNNIYILKKSAQPVILVSTGRTGTKFFSRFFHDYGLKVSSYHTTKYTRLVNVLCNVNLMKFLPKAATKVVWKLLKEKTILSHHSRYIECNPYYYNIIDIIVELFPKTKFIFVVRSPKSYILSHIKWEKTQWKSMIANKLIPFWQPVSYFDELKGMANNYYQRVEFYSKVWAIKNRVIWKSVTENKNAITLRFEEIFDPEKGTAVIEHLMDWLEIPLRQNLHQKSLTKKVNASRSDSNMLWDERCAQIMQEYCGSMMRKFGYNEEPIRSSVVELQ